jgi:hypothetical protein
VVIERALGIDGGVEHDRLQDQPERAELVFLAGRPSRPRLTSDSASSLCPWGTPTQGEGQVGLITTFTATVKGRAAAVDPAILGRELVIAVVDVATRRLRRSVRP